MISFRYHIVSLVAVFLALAVGIVVGTTALNGPITTDLRNQVNGLKSDRSQLADQVKALQGQVDDAGQFAATFGSQLVAGTLADTKVLMVALPGAPTGHARRHRHPARPPPVPRSPAGCSWPPASSTRPRAAASSPWPPGRATRSG